MTDKRLIATLTFILLIVISTQVFILEWYLHQPAGVSINTGTCGTIQ